MTEDGADVRAEQTDRWRSSETASRRSSMGWAARPCGGSCAAARRGVRRRRDFVQDPTAPCNTAIAFLIASRSRSASALP